jgi:3-(methylthio)propionyl---CoA ligase
VKKPGQDIDKSAILEFLSDKVAKWWLADEIIFVDSLPLGATGKVQKMELRRKYGDVLAAAS